MDGKPEKLTEFKDIESTQSASSSSANDNKKSILKKLLSLNRASSINDLNSDSLESLSSKQNVNENQNEQQFKDSSREKFDDSFSQSTENLSNQSDNDSISNSNVNLSSSTNAIASSIASSTSATGATTYSIPNILKQIYNINTQKSGVADGSSREFWMPDDQVKECFDCNDKFTTIRRKHHCRMCGQIFCSKCSNYKIPARLIWQNGSGNIRVCKFCHSLADQLENGELLQNRNSIKELMKRLSISSYSLLNPASKVEYEVETDQPKTSSNQESTKTINSIAYSKMNNPFDVEEKELFKSQDNEITKLILNNASELRNLWIQLYHTSDGVQFQTRNINTLKKITNCITSTELIDWLVKKKGVSRDQAIVIGQALVHGKWLVCVNNASQDHEFSGEFAYYKPGPAALAPTKTDQNIKKNTIEADEGPDWIKDLNKQEEEPIANQQQFLQQQQQLQQEQQQKQQQQQQQTSQYPQTLYPSQIQQIITNNNAPITLSPLSLLNIQQSTEIKIKTSKESEDNDEDMTSYKAPNFYTISSSASSSTSTLSIQAQTSNMNYNNNAQPQTTSKSAETVKKQKTELSAQDIEYINEMNKFQQSDDLQLLYKTLQLELLTQLLKLYNLPFDWFDIILDLAWKSVDLVKPDVKHDNDSMDIRNYIKIKKLPGGSKSDCRIVNGIVFTKNVAHKQMKTEMKNPKILLLRSSIEYQRVEEKLCALQPLFIAETQYLRNNCSKLLRLSPDIIVVEKSVARIAQEFLLQSGVTLILNVKSRVMDILCRFLQADSMYSIDDLLKKPRLGFCSKFRVDKYKLDEDSSTTKPLMYFEGTPTNLGCTILLTGASNNELSIIKALTNFMIYVAYNSKLEQSLLVDSSVFFKNTIKTNDDNKVQFSIGDDTNTLQQTTPTTVESIIRKSIEDIKSKHSNGNNWMQFIIDILDNNTQTATPKDSDNVYKELANKFNKLLNKLILSCSPFVKYTLPYLLLSQFDNCTLENYVPDKYIDYYNSKLLNINDNVHVVDRIFDKKIKINKNNGVNLNNSNTNDCLSDQDDCDNVWSYEYEKKLCEPHQFTKIHLTKSLNDLNVKKMYADYRSRGHRIALNLINKNEIIKEKTEEANKKQEEIIKDCFDAVDQQNLTVLFYSKCESSPLYPNICIKPRVIDMTYYGENDMTLGSFLTRHCFRNGYLCTNELCNTLILNHTRYFVHADSQITIRMCTINDEQTYMGMLNTNLLSNQSNNTQSNVQNSANNQNTNNDKVDYNTTMQESKIFYDDLSIYMWSSCRVCSKRSKKVIMSPDTWSYSLAKFLELKFYANNYKLLCTQTNTNNKADSTDIELCRHSLFHQYDQYFRFRNMQTIFSYSKITLRRLELPPTELNIKLYSKYRTDYIDEIKDLSEKGLTLFSTLIDRLSALRGTNLNDKQVQKLEQYIIQINSDMTLKHKIEKINLLLTRTNRNNLNELSLTHNPSLQLSTSPQSTNSVTLTDSNETEPVDYDQIELLLIDLKKYIANNINNWNNKMIDFIKKSKYDDASSLEGNNELVLSAEAPKTTTPKIENSEAKRNSQKDDECTFEKRSTTSLQDSNENTNTASTTSTNYYYQNQNDALKSNESNTSLQVKSANQEIDDDHSKSTPISMKRIFTNLLSNSTFQPLKMPFPEDEHYLLNIESSYYVNEKHLSSIIAFTLSCKDYKEFLNKKSNQSDGITVVNNNNSGNNNNYMNNGNNQNPRKQQLSSVPSTNLIQNKENIPGMPNPNQDIDDVDSSNPNANLAKTDSDLHFCCQFQDSTTKFYCKVYYADLFCQLRKLLLNNDEERYIHSLFHCMAWEARGGRSNSQFHKTLDNRFILKAMSSKEIQSFLVFAPKYIQYVSNRVQNKEPTSLTKIVGAYRVSLMRNTALSSTKAFDVDVLVMENLFYTKNCGQVFDLKGSERNRLINIEGRQQEKELVLLDENFLRWSFDNPIYIKCHAKRVLMKAIAADAEFLSSKFVMDYSLLCGFDHVNNQVVVGIIDYIRTFTWDKKLETYIKTIGSQGKMPTIVSPSVYQTRFINAIDRYFLEVPDHWYQESKNVE